MASGRNNAGDIYAVVLVGGKGKRLRPLSTDRRPKAFLSVTRDRKSMFSNTVRRISGLIPASRVIVVANRAHKNLVRRDFSGLKDKNLILEPVSRNTAPAAGLAAREIRRMYGNVIMAILPTDQYVQGEVKYLACLEKAAEFLRGSKDSIVVFGIKPTKASTEFGYIKLGKARAGGRAANVLKVDRFVEKPDTAKARKYLASGKYLWNSGAFMLYSETLLKLLRVFAPGIYRGLKDGKRPAAAYANMPDISLDYAVIEKAKRIYCVRGDYGWSDAGSFDELKKLLRKESRDFLEKDGKIVRIY